MTCLVATMLEPRLDLRNPDALNGPQWPDKLCLSSFTFAKPDL